MPTLRSPATGRAPIKKICFKIVDDAYWDETE